MPFSASDAFSDGMWYHAKLEEGLYYSYEVKKVLFNERSKFQTIDIIDTIPFGRLIISDGISQSSYCDEYAYHEGLVHPALLAHGNPKRVFIAGGGEGATLRECLRHSSIEQAIMVDIDETAVKMCKEHMPNHSAGAFSDPRAKIIYDDARVQLEAIADDSLDAIILDLCDPVDGGPAYKLYTVEFYTICSKKLNSNGVLVTQSGSASIREVIANSPIGVFSPVYNTLKQVFTKVSAYTTFIPTFCSEWGWTIAFKNPDAQDIVTCKDIDAKLKAAKLDSQLKFYDQITHDRMFALAKSIRKVLNEETRIINLANPLFMTDAIVGIL
jgi:thermospermine synthase